MIPPALILLATSTAVPDGFRGQAEAALAQKDWPALRSAAEAFTAAHPKDGRAWGYLAMAHANEGHLEEAEKALERGTAADPDFVGNWYNLALVRIQLGRSRDAAAACLDRLAAAAPEKALALLSNPEARQAFAPPAETVLDLGKVPFEGHPRATWKNVPHYPKAARQAQVQGSVWIDLLVDQAGRVVGIDHPAGPKELIDSALYCAVQFRFPPLVREGGPRAYRMTYEIPFKLR